MKKLIRDNIPEIMRSQGKRFNIERIEDDKEYFNFLKEKLLEEVKEFNDSKNIDEEKEEMADIFEVIETILEFKKIDKNKIEEYKLKKKNERGGFTKRIILLDL